MGVASVPPGEVGSDGRRIWYEEGADLMREKDAEGGAYKRWDHVVCILNMGIRRGILIKYRIN